ncbi:MAG TPA: hypothetical protein DEG17_15735 [Cyanobacteria bacterium UBA11149]|nr:hypothetical protein [Cyanobacteria bacterium UBA11367]HBE60805.1 hypothetical protein [Cyanobacteria bacterium UBA11366]HBK66408.1 hypothetical protein [Cyanobacteria bacterium UBA11166]HBR73659.1 hypothetical protein [Cyanobacteria bacterium UBA11159]HBS72210.1 hypothetical protein [Cyanobacteria bacterium UBA11153]HBW90282.1 hypothetical protein [Cyanobacteria bacterium UBA11149]HCA98186.1 hypothetical protein [Cyanobacteria bacterium UBA9226]
MSYATEQKIELQIQKGIRQTEDNLVVWIEDALEKTKYGDLEESQFRNLLRVSETTDSAEVIKNFIHYQVGRDQKWGRGKESLAERLIQDINSKIKEEAQKIAKSSQSDFKPIWLELIRRYLGYGSRHLTYLRKGKS